MAGNFRKGLRFPNGIPRIKTNREQIPERVDGSLRDRIAAAIMDSCHGVYMDDAANAADTLIRELGTDCIYRYGCHQCGDFWFDKSERMQRFALLHGKSHQ